MPDLETAFRRREIYFICHDVIAEEGLIAGQSDVGIRPSPRSKYDAVRRALSQFDGVEWYRGPERRCQQTAARILGEVEWEESNQIAARQMGAWQGKTWKDIRKADSVRAEAFWSNYASAAAPGDGESVEVLRNRANAFLVGMGHRDVWNTAVAVCAPETVAAVVCDALQVDMTTSLRFNVDPLSITRLSHSWIGWQVDCVNASY